MTPALEVAGYVVGVLMVLAGIAGTVLPLLPSTPLTFLGFWLLAWLGDYSRVSGWVVGVLAALTALSLATDFLAGLLGATRVGASRWALLGAALGSLVGLGFGFFGVVLGPLLGAALGELWDKNDLRRAGQVALATWIGMLVGTIAKVALTWMMVGIFLVAWLF